MSTYQKFCREVYNEIDPMIRKGLPLVLIYEKATTKYGCSRLFVDKRIRHIIELDKYIEEERVKLEKRRAEAAKRDEKINNKEKSLGVVPDIERIEEDFSNVFG